MLWLCGPTPSMVSIWEAYWKRLKEVLRMSQPLRSKPITGQIRQVSPSKVTGERKGVSGQVIIYVVFKTLEHLHVFHLHGYWPSRKPDDVKGIQS